MRELEHTWREKFTVTGGDQIVVVVDLKGCQLKQLTNKQALTVFKDVVLTELPRLYPSIVNKVLVLNAPLFFESLYESEIKARVPKGCTLEISAKAEISHKMVNLPSCYGGDCNFSIASEAGPWCEEQKFEESKDGFSAMIEHEDDRVDILNERESFDLGDLRAQLQMGKWNCEITRLALPSSNRNKVSEPPG